MPDQPVGQPTENKASNKAEQEWHGSHEAGFRNAHMALDFQIAGQPRDEQPADIDIPEEAQHQPPGGAEAEQAAPGRSAQLPGLGLDALAFASG
jgi:hypothetical protein